MTTEKLQAEIEELRQRLEEAEETIRAIRSGAVDAFVVEEAAGPRVYTLEGADRPYRLLVEQMQQGAATLTEEGVIVYCNRRLADLLKTPHEKLIGTALHDFIASEDRPLYDHMLSEGSRLSGGGEARVQSADGAVTPAYLTFNVLPKDCGAAIGVLITDLTAQRHHEQLALAHEERRLSEERLRQLAAELSDADRRKNEFLAMLAHELRNPLAPIRNALHVIRLSDGRGDAIGSASEMMERQLAQMVRLVNDLLDISRITRGKIELRQVRIDAATAVNHAVEAARALAQCMEHELTVVLPFEPIYLQADPARLTQVIGNLLNNACKFTDKGGRISLTIEREGEHVVFRVRDNGIGIVAEQLPRIFDMFTQLDTSLERSVSGLGIGLTLVKNLVEMHRGTVEVRSAGAGQGSEFVVRLPILVETPPPPEPTVVSDAPPNSLRVLVVDDNRDSADSLVLLLALNAHDARPAYDGLEAVELAESFRPDVVLLDIGLPKLNGYEACRRIRKEPWGGDMMLVALTGWGQEEDRRKSVEAGFDCHMVKPIDLDRLMRLLAGHRTAE